MKTPTLDKLLGNEGIHPSALADGIRAAVAEDMRAACEEAWEDGYHEAFAVMGNRARIKWNPYTRKASA